MKLRERIYDEDAKIEPDTEVVRVKVKRKPRFISLWSQRLRVSVA